MPAENTAIDPFKFRARKFRMLAEGSHGSRLDYLVLAAAYEALVTQTGPSEAIVKEPTMGNLAA